MLSIAPQDKEKKPLTVNLPSRIHARFKALAESLDSDDDYVMTQILDAALPKTSAPKTVKPKAKTAGGYA